MLEPERGAIRFNILALLGRHGRTSGRQVDGENQERNSGNAKYKHWLIVLLFLLPVHLFATDYYVSASGLDTNDGLQKTDDGAGHGPWLHAPFMPNCTDNCLKKWSGTAPYAKLSASDRVIFRGGETWHFGDSGATPYTGGTWNFNVSPWAKGTNLGAGAIYIGVDATWYSGGSWARPILTGDNPPCNANTLGANCHSGTYPGGFYYVDSCAHQIGTTNQFFNLSGPAVGNIIIDNFELTGMCANDVGQPADHNVYFDYGSAGAPIQFSNNYTHGASHVQFAGASGSVSCTASAVCFNSFVFRGSVTTGSVGETINRNAIDFSDSDGIGQGLSYAGMYDVYENYIAYTSQGVMRDLRTFHDNLYEYFFENGHSNVLEDFGDSCPTAIYNNVFRHIETTGGTGGVLLWPRPVAAGCTNYTFNNLAHDVKNVQYLNVGGGTPNAAGDYVVFNNTFQSNVSQSIVNCASMTGSLNDANNHYVTDAASAYITGCTPTGSATNLKQSNADATTAGYTSSEGYAYSPPSAGAATVGAGTDEGASNLAACSALTAAGLTDAASACASGTTYSCVYQSSDHTVVCPALTATARGATWDIGAFQYDAGAAAPTIDTFLRAGDINAGSCTTLTWTTTNADALSIAGVGSFAADADASVCPTRTTTYTATATGAGGSDSASVTVHVGGKVRGSRAKQ